MKYKSVRLKSDDVVAVIENLKSEFRIPLRFQDVIGSDFSDVKGLIASLIILMPHYNILRIVLVRLFMLKKLGRREEIRICIELDQQVMNLTKIKTRFVKYGGSQLRRCPVMRRGYFLKLQI